MRAHSRSLLRIGLVAAAMVLATAGCAGDDGGKSSASGTSADDQGDGDGGGTGGPGEELEEALTFMNAMAGLWVGPVTMTPLGEFPVMNMDARSTDGHTLFSRADLDKNNSLRFAFAIEDHGLGPELIYRNGGLFTGLVRDSRTRVESVDADAGIWRFCSTHSGCDYIDATFEIEGDDLLLDVKVKGEQHVYWTATRAETRALPEPFPVDQTPVGNGTNDFPPMPHVNLDVSWSDPLAEAADVWVILSATQCGPTVDCTPSRTFAIEAPAGATSVTGQIDQIHPGAYFGAAILDRNRNFFMTLFPDTGDSVSIPDAPVTIAPSGGTDADFSIVVDI